MRNTSQFCSHFEYCRVMTSVLPMRLLWMRFPAEFKFTNLRLMLRRNIIKDFMRTGILQSGLAWSYAALLSKWTTSMHVLINQSKKNTAFQVQLQKWFLKLLEVGYLWDFAIVVMMLSSSYWILYLPIEFCISAIALRRGYKHSDVYLRELHKCW